ncbi:MAG: pseudouridine synthase [Candidatus Bathyarchaeota archaeon]|jgi:predicted RNA-binding protein (TIGR00451 family)
MEGDLGRLRAIADYQFGLGTGEALFPEGISVEHSRGTGKIRLIFMEEALIATLRPTDGYLTLTIAGARRLASSVNSLGCAVTLMDDVAEVVAQGKNLMAKHVVSASSNIRPWDEVVVLDSKKGVVAVGRALLTKEEMLAFQTGVAVKTRRGRDRDR